jgi:multiple sugar transport system permease protein
MWIPPAAGLALIMPVAALLAAVILVPELWALWASFHDLRLGGVPEPVGTENYRLLLTDPRFLEALLRTFLYVGVTLAIELVIAIPAALLLARRFPLQGLWLALIVAPYAVSNVVGVAAWRHMLLTDTGYVNGLLAWLGVDRVNWLSDPSFAFISVVLVSVWRELPFVLMIVYAALLSVPAELKEAAKVDGAGPLQSFRHVVLPIILPAVMVAVVFRLVFALRQFDIVWLLTQGGPGQATELVSIFLYRTGFRYFDFGAASAIAWIMTLATLAVSYWAVKAMYAALWRAQRVEA